jgi:hypothetical protein
MLLEDVASALRDRGNIWQGCHIAILLSEDEYVPRQTSEGNASVGQDASRSSKCSRER